MRGYKGLLVAVLIIALVYCCVCFVACGKKETHSTDLIEQAGDPMGDAEGHRVIEAGTYKIGEDIPAGEYYFVVTKDADNGGIVEVSANGSFDDITQISCSEFIGASLYLTVFDNQYLHFIDCTAVQSKKTEIGRDAKLYEEGMYKVGQDIRPGKYDIYPMNGKNTYFGIYVIYKDSLHNEESIVDMEYFDEASYVEIEEGQYLIIEDAYIEF